jgi:hypothetical protein
MQSGWMNNFDSHCISELRIIFPDLLLKSKYVLEPCCQRVQGYTVLCISLETIIKFQVPRNRSPHGVRVFEKKTQNWHLYACLIRRISFNFFGFFYVISILFGPSIKILPISPTLFSDTSEVCPWVKNFWLRHCLTL